MKNMHQLGSWSMCVVNVYLKIRPSAMLFKWSAKFRKKIVREDVAALIDDRNTR